MFFVDDVFLGGEVMLGVLTFKARSREGHAIFHKFICVGLDLSIVCPKKKHLIFSILLYMIIC